MANYMSVGLVAVLFGTGSALAWGLADFLAARALMFINVLEMALISNLCGAAVFYFAYFLLLESAPFSVSGAISSSMSGLLYAVGMIAFLRGLKQGAASVISPISSTYPVVTQLVGMTLFGSGGAIFRIVGTVLIVIGVSMAVSRSPRGANPDSSRLAPEGPLYAIVAAVTWGVSFSLVAQGVAKSGWATATALQLGFALATFASAYAIACWSRARRGGASADGVNLTQAQESKQENADLALRAPLRVGLRAPVLFIVLLSALTQLTGTILFNFGVTQGLGSEIVVASVSALYPIVTMLLAYRFLQERLPSVALLGGVLAVLGVVVLSAS